MSAVMKMKKNDTKLEISQTIIYLLTGLVRGYLGVVVNQHSLEDGGVWALLYFCMRAGGYREAAGVAGEARWGKIFLEAFETFFFSSIRGRGGEVGEEFFLDKNCTFFFKFYFKFNLL